MRVTFALVFFAALCLVVGAVVKRDNSLDIVKLPDSQAIHSHAGAYGAALESILTFGGVKKDGTTRSSITQLKSKDTNAATSGSGGTTNPTTGGTTSGATGGTDTEEAAVVPEFDIVEEVPPEATAGTFCSVDSPYRCPTNEALCVRDASECPLPNGCAAATPVLCGDQSTCVKTEAECPGGLAAADGATIEKKCTGGTPVECLDGNCYPEGFVCCPLSRPIKCPDGSCAAAADKCAGAVVVQCPPPEVPCPDGTCVPDITKCSNTAPTGSISPCPTGKVFCSDNICHDHCPTGTTQVGGTTGGTTGTCPGDTPHRCPDGRCVKDLAMCTTNTGTTQCGPPNTFVCPNGGCAADAAGCTSTTGGTTGCVEPTPHKCPDGACAKDSASCPGGTGGGGGCVSPTPHKCPDGACAADANSCPGGTGDGGGCVSPTPHKCPDGACAADSASCPSGGGNCGPPNTFNCPNGGCAADAASCPTRRVILEDGATIVTPHGYTLDEKTPMYIQQATSVPALTRHAMASLGNMIIVFGGVVGSTYTNDMYLLGAAQGGEKYAIQKMTDPVVRPSPRADHSLCTVDLTSTTQALYVFGGQGADGNALGDLQVYELSGENPQFVTKSGIDLPSPRWGHTTGVYNERAGGRTLGVFVHGGTDGTETFDDMWEIFANPRKLTFASTSNPPPRAFHAGIMFGHMYVIYGGKGADGTILNDGWRTYFGGSNTSTVWEPLTIGDGTTPPPPLYRMAYLKDAGRLQVQGGITTTDDGAEVTTANLLQFNLACPPGFFSDPDTNSDCYPCEPGTYSPNVGASACVQCPKGTYAANFGQPQCTECPTFELATTEGIGSKNITDCQCVDIIAFGEQGGACKACPVGATCSGTVITAINEYYQSANDPELLWRCDPPDACLGGNQCSTGYTGVRCSACQRSPTPYYKLNERCEECPKTSRAAIISIIIMVLFAFCVVLYQISEGGDSMSTVSISLQYFQVQGILSGFKVDWPPQVLTVLEYMTIINFNLDLTSPECTSPMDFFDKFTLFMVLPIIFVFLFATIVALVFAQAAIMTKIKGPRIPWEEMTEEEQEKGWWKHMWYRPADPVEFMNRTCNAFCLFVLLVYVPVLAKILQFFDCTTNLDGSITLDAEVQVLCWEGRHTKYLPLACVALAGYGIGIPLTFWMILRKKNFFDPVFLMRFGTLYDKYDREYYYWELVNLLRKVILVAASLFFTNLVFGQLIFALFMAFGILVWQSFAEPYREQKDNRLDFSLMLANLLLLFAAFLFFADVVNCVKRDKPREKGKLCLFPSETSKNVVAWILVVLIILTLIAIVALFCYDLYRWNQRRKKTAAEREAEEKMPEEQLTQVRSFFHPFAVEFVDRWFQYQGLRSRKTLGHLLDELDRSAGELAVAFQKGQDLQPILDRKHAEMEAEDAMIEHARMGGHIALPAGHAKYAVTPVKGGDAEFGDPPVKPPNPYAPKTEDGVLKEHQTELKTLEHQQELAKERQEQDLERKIQEKRKERELAELRHDIDGDHSARSSGTDSNASASARADAALLPGALPESPRAGDAAAPPPPALASDNNSSAGTDSNGSRQRNFVSVYED
eukprot:TRINITY_DN2086_c0_g1_i1.p1 TRINITY_DN2086_c0_g1~~TRINITY_DN2086_c0_g1_i1.p1  ORF type:complete len:1586 (-),score=452.98 TRINITY_DN2086_c0_g1_i1:190-4947(-)